MSAALQFLLELDGLRLVSHHEGHAALVDLVLRHPARLHALGGHQRLRARLQLACSARRALYKAVLIVERIVVRHVRHLGGCFQSTPFGPVCLRPPSVDNRSRPPSFWRSQNLRICLSSTSRRGFAVCICFERARLRSLHFALKGRGW